MRSVLMVLLAWACGTQLGIAADPPALPGLCEASAAHWMACADGSGLCLLVGDNEDDSAVFEYRADRQGELTTSPSWRQPIGQMHVGDIEAVTALNGDLVVVGSHSRKKKCDREVERLRLLRLKASRSAAGLRTFSATASVVEADLAKWLDKLTNCTTKLIVLSGPYDTEDARNLRDEVCKAIVDAESAAGEGKQTSDEAEARCQGTFNIEAAVGLPDAGAKERLWLGLRAPLLRQRAILLRVASVDGAGDGLRFDGLATIDLGGLGLRELAASEDWLYGLAGPVPDGGERRTVADKRFKGGNCPSALLPAARARLPPPAAFRREPTPVSATSKAVGHDLDRAAHHRVSA